MCEMCENCSLCVKVVQINTHNSLLAGQLHQHHYRNRRKEGHFVFNDVLNTFYLLLYGEREKQEGNVLFNDAPNTFYLLLCEERETGRKCFI